MAFSILSFVRNHTQKNFMPGIVQDIKNAIEILNKMAISGNILDIEYVYCAIGMLCILIDIYVGNIESYDKILMHYKI